MKKKLLILISILVLVMLFLFFGTYKDSPQTLIQNDGLSIVVSDDSVSISENKNSVNIFLCVVENTEIEKEQFLMYATSEKRIFGKSFYKAITSQLCEIESINQKNNIADNSLLTYIDKENIAYYGLAPKDCEQVFINDKKMNVEKRTITTEKNSYSYSFYYGVFGENEVISESYYVDSAGVKHDFDLDILYF